MGVDRRPASEIVGSSLGEELGLARTASETVVVIFGAEGERGSAADFLEAFIVEVMLELLGTLAVEEDLLNFDASEDVLEVEGTVVEVAVVLGALSDFIAAIVLSQNILATVASENQKPQYDLPS